MANIGDRFKTGQTCPASGVYIFDGYVEAGNKPSPTQEERVIPVDEGKTFPPVRSSGEGAFWKLQRKT